MRSRSLPRLVVPRCLVAPCCSSCPSPSRRISPVGAFHPGEAAIPGEVIYSAPFSSAHLIHPGSSPHPSHGSPSHPSKQAGRARRRAVIGGSRHRHRIPAPSRLRPVSPLVSACGAKSVSFPSVPCRHRARASHASFAVVKTFQSFLGSVPQPSRQASRQGRPVPVPSLVSAGGSHRPFSRIGFRSHAIDTAGTQAGDPRPVRPPRSRFCPSCRPRGSSPGPSVNRRKGKAKRPVSPCRGTGRKASL